MRSSADQEQGRRLAGLLVFEKDCVEAAFEYADLVRRTGQRQDEILVHQIPRRSTDSGRSPMARDDQVVGDGAPEPPSRRPPFAAGRASGRPATTAPAASYDMAATPPPPRPFRPAADTTWRSASPDGG